MTFADYLRATQITANLTQKELAQALGVSPQYLNDLLHGRRAAPSDDHLRGLASILEVPLDTLLYYANRLPPDTREHVLLDAEIQEGYAALRKATLKASTSRAPLTPEEHTALSETLDTQLRHNLENSLSDPTVAEILRWRWTVYLALKHWAEQQEQADQRFYPEVWLTPEDAEAISEKIGWPRLFPTPTEGDTHE